MADGQHRRDDTAPLGAAATKESGAVAAAPDRDAYREDGGATPALQRYGVLALRAFLAVMFIAAGATKIYGTQSMVEVFEAVGIGQWFRLVTGALEVVGAALFLVPATVLHGAALLACICVGAAASHVLGVPGSPLPAITLLVFVLAAAWLHRRVHGARP